MDFVQQFLHFVLISKCNFRKRSCLTLIINMFAGCLIAQLYRLQYAAIKINNLHYRVTVICKRVVCYRIEASDRI